MLRPRWAHRLRPMGGVALPWYCALEWTQRAAMAKVILTRPCLSSGGSERPDSIAAGAVAERQPADNDPNRTYAELGQAPFIARPGGYDGREGSHARESRKVRPVQKRFEATTWETTRSPRRCEDMRRLCEHRSNGAV